VDTLAADMSKPKDHTKVNSQNMIKTTMEYLFEESKRDINQVGEFYRELCPDSFSMTRVGKTVQKTLFTKPLFHGESNISKSKGLTMTEIFDVIDTMVHHALINHSRVLVNTL
jgi:hypothetical protein